MSNSSTPRSVVVFANSEPDNMTEPSDTSNTMQRQTLDTVIVKTEKTDEEECEENYVETVYVGSENNSSEQISRSRVINSLSASYAGKSFRELQQQGLIVMRGESKGDNCSNNSSSALASGQFQVDQDYHVEAFANRLTQSCFSQLKAEDATEEEYQEMDEYEEEEDEDYYEDDEGVEGTVDEELTCLNWLQDSNLLRNSDGTTLWGAPLDEDDERFQKENDGYEYFGQAHPSHIPYHPQKHANSKPPYSFSCLIFMAIEDSPDKKLPVKDIYNWILTNFPYFQHAPTGWKNSVRHNLSLNKCFKKVDKDRGSVSPTLGS